MMDNKMILLLKDTFGDRVGSIIEIEEETENEIYYTDGFDRWVYLNKSDEGVDWMLL